MQPAPNSASRPGPWDLDPAQWQRTTRALVRVARSVVGQDDLAEDVVQGAWLRALQRGDAVSMGWLRRLVESRAIDVVRQRALRAGASHFDAELPEAAEPAEHLLERIEVQRAVLDAVEALAEPHRTAIYLRYFEDLTPSQIAARTGAPLKTVKSRLTRALALLRARLEQKFRSDTGARWAPALIVFARGMPSAVPAAFALQVLALVSMKKLALVSIAFLALGAGWLALDGMDWLPVQRSVEPSTNAALQTDVADLKPPPEAGESKRRPADSGAAEQGAIAATSDPASAFGALRVHVAWSDGTPAGGIRVVASIAGPVRESTQRFLRTSGADGIAFFSRLPARVLELNTDRGDWEPACEATLFAGQTGEARLTLRDGFEVVGRVVDTSGRSVGGAGIWISSQTGGWTAGAIATHADGAGRFELRDLPAESSLGAVADGFLPSELVDLELLDRSRVPFDVVLALASGGAVLEGTVRDAKGEPVVGAVVAVGDADPHSDRRTDGTVKERWTARVANTDESGRYAIVGLLPGSATVRVLALEFAQVSARIELAEGQRSRWDPVLDAGAKVLGVVRDPAGRPVSGATVHAFDLELSEAHLQQGQLDYAGAFPQVAAATDLQGRYELTNVSTGTLFLYVFELIPADPLKEALVRYVKQEFTLAAGGSAIWNPVLNDGRVIHGFMRYRDGKPLTNVFVSLTRSDSESAKDLCYRSLYSQDGSFRFIQLGGGPFDVRVQIFELPKGTREPEQLRVMPDGLALELVVGFDAPGQLASSKVAVRFEDSGRRVPKGAAVGLVLQRIGGTSTHFGEFVGDLWSFELEEPGRYRPLAFHGDRLIAFGRTFEIEAGENLDLGVLASQPGATLVFVPVGELAANAHDLNAHLTHEDVDRGEQLEFDGTPTLRIENVEPGPGRVSIRGTGFLTRSYSFDAQAGIETRVELQLQAGVSVPYRILLNAESKPVSLSLRFVDRTSGKVIDSFAHEDLTQLSNPIEWAATLPLGAFAFEVELGDGKRHSLEFALTSLDQKLAPNLQADLR